MSAERRAYYAANKERWVANVLRNRKKKQDWLAAIKLARGCARCGYNEHPAALVFHHINGSEDKRDALSKLVREAGLDRLSAEIAKCEVLCQNCHHIIHSDLRRIP